ncbi:hypothetical protein HMSSN139_10040 [Paenibacillus sp. HMSSN-139]|nr:hypothetical protein HMSSN139_10040 [Paenibacillus sp. HMSSN-139]
MNIEKSFYNYDKHGTNYAGYRRTDPRIERQVLEALGQANTIINVGSGTGSYEPKDRYVVAVEPSAVMRGQRLARGAVPAVNAWAEALPFDDRAFDAGMAMVTVHHWLDIHKGLRELRRVVRGNVVVLTFDPDALDSFWNAEYFPELLEAERRRYPKPDEVLEALGGSGHILPVPSRRIASMDSRKLFTAVRRPSWCLKCAKPSRHGNSWRGEWRSGSCISWPRL